MTMKIERVDAAVQPTAGEAANGWAAAALARYIAERNLAAGETILNRKPTKPMRCNSKYSVFQWRR
jgi:hypothetical protein